MIHQVIDIVCDYAAAKIPDPVLSGYILPDISYQPKLHTYILDNSIEMQPFRRRPAVIICPGGGYEFTSFREGEHIALRMNALGFNAFILSYSCKPAIFPAALLELATAVSLIRNNAAAWHIDPKRIIVAGFSAGGHLAASLGVFWNDKTIFESLGVKPARIRPNGLLLSYPVISSGEYAHASSFKSLLGENHDALLSKVSLENQVTADTPPTFLWHTYEDALVPVENSLLFATALRKNGIPFELHIYKPGGHGLSAATAETANTLGWGIQVECQNWIEMAGTWIKNL